MRRRGIGRRGPGLAGTVARTAVIAGTASAVAGGVSRSQEAKAQAAQGQQQAAIDASVAAQLAAQPAAAPPPPAAAAPAAGDTDALIEQLTKLGQLRDAGVLTDAEFEAQKAKLLAG
jgi:hypothetical protein